MRRQPGDTFHHSITGEQGRLLRVAKVNGRLAYIVAIVNPASGKELEALWWPREIVEIRARMSRSHGQAARNQAARNL